MPEASLADLRARLVEKQERVAKLEARRDDLAEERTAAKREYAEALGARDAVVTADDLVDRFSLDELREKVGEIGAESATLADTEPTIQSGDAPETASLSLGDRERVRELESRLEDLPERDSGLVARERERIESELAELRGGDS